MYLNFSRLYEHPNVHLLFRILVMQQKHLLDLCFTVYFREFTLVTKLTLYKQAVNRNIFLQNPELDRRSVPLCIKKCPKCYYKNVMKIL